MERDESFESWYDEYFLGIGGEWKGKDIPYSYDDVKIAFYAGWKASPFKAKDKK